MLATLLGVGFKYIQFIYLLYNKYNVMIFIYQSKIHKWAYHSLLLLMCYVVKFLLKNPRMH